MATTLATPHEASISDRPRTLDRLVGDAVRRRPDAVALRHQGSALTFAEMSAQADRWLSALHANGVRAGDLVGVCLTRTPALVAALLAIHRAGAAYVPLDPAYPAARIDHIVRDSQARLVLTERSTEGVLGDADRLLLEDLPAEPDGVPSLAGPRPEDLAYVIYTSGSTGLPKGVAIEHRQAAALVAWAADVYDADDFSGVLFSTSICFDLSVFEIFATLAHGGTLVIADHALALPGLPDVAAVRLVNTVPSAIGVLARQGEIPPTVRTVNLAGEPLTRALTDAVYEAPGVERVYNLYGPSEDTTYSTWTLVPRDGDEEPTIGRPLPGTRAYLLDPEGRPVPQGEVGELYLAGAGVTRGYLGRPALTAERYLPDPHHPGDRMYRTGDLAQLGEDAQLRYRGRTDHQVKIRGFRVELGEIEATLVRHAQAAQATVVVRPDSAGSPALVAFVESSVAPDGVAQLVTELRARCEERLPHYMVPSLFSVLDRLPLTPNGKVDRGALPDAEPVATPSGAAPESDDERLVAAIWAEVLALPEPPGVDLSFAALGGHSLLAAAVVHRIGRATGRALRLADFGVGATVRDLVAALARSTTAAAAAPVAGGSGTGRSYAATPSQAEFFVLEEMAESSAVAVMPVILHTDRPVRLDLLRRTLDLMPVRHEVLRTAVDAQADGPTATVVPAATVPFTEVSTETELRALADQPIRLIEGRLLAAAAVVEPHRPGLTDRVLIRVHHGAFDGWSIGLLVRDLAEVYAAAAESREATPASALQFADGADWLDRERSRARAVSQPYWERRLAGPPPLAVLPPTVPGHRSRRPARPGAMITHPLAPGAMDAVAAFAADHEVTPFACLLAATALRVQRETGVTDMVIQVPVSNRRHPDLEEVIGPFLETAPARVDVSGNPTFAQLARRIAEATAVDLDHSWVDTPQMYQPLGHRRGADAEPVGGLLVAVQGYAMGARTAGGITWLATEELGNGAAKTDLSFFWELTHPTGPQLQVELDTDLHTVEGVQRYAEQILRLLRAGIAAPERPVGDLDWAGPEDVEAFAALNARAPLQATTPAPQQIADLARTQPHAVAVVDVDGSTVSYGDLHATAVATATRILAATGAGAEPVAVAARRGAAGIAAMLSAWYAGRPYLPLDSAHPPARLAEVIADSGAVALLADDSCPALELDGVARLAVPAGRPVVAGVGPAVPTGLPAPDDLAYLIYTSGSTGKPKGVRIQHGALASFLAAMGEVVPLDPQDVVTYLTTPSFDIAGLEMWLPLTSGAAVGVVSEDTARDGFALTERIRELGATLVQATPSGWQVVLDAGAELPPLRALVGAEPVPPTLAATLLGRAEEVWNVYGPTEATIWSCTHRVRSEDCRGTSLPIGRPLPNTATYVLDHAGRLAPVGAIGAIYLAGTSLAEGYHERADLTSAAFTIAAGLPGSPRIYRTGDLGRLRPDGVLECLGRADNQVKVRGVRIELEEVDEAIRRAPEVARATSRVQPDGPSAGQLVGYVVPAAGHQMDAAALRTHLARALPAAMIPTLWVQLDTLPLNTAGKVARRSLPEPVAADSGAPAVPLSELEEFLAEIWAPHLPGVRLTPDGDFFELGGHSLTAMRVVAQARTELELEIPVRVLFQHSRLAAFAAQVEHLLAQEPTA